jgi:nitroreductase
VRFVIVRDAEKKQKLGEWYIQPWKQYFNAAMEGMRALEAESGDEKATWIGYANAEKALKNADQFAEKFGEHPTIVVVCAALEDTHPTDTDLGRLSIVGGASVYPIAQNFCLALRNQGVATSFTTLLCMFEPQVKELLGIPDDYATACHIVAGYPAKGFPKKLSRRPVEELAFVDTFGEPLSRSSAVAV